jgi:hypothetical protein
MQLSQMEWYPGTLESLKIKKQSACRLDAITEKAAGIKNVGCLKALDTHSSPLPSLPPEWSRMTLRCIFLLWTIVFFFSNYSLSMHFATQETLT